MGYLSDVGLGDIVEGGVYLLSGGPLNPDAGTNAQEARKTYETGKELVIELYDITKTGYNAVTGNTETSGARSITATAPHSGNDANDTHWPLPGNPKPQNEQTLRELLTVYPQFYDRAQWTLSGDSRFARWLTVILPGGQPFVHDANGNIYGKHVDYNSNAKPLSVDYKDYTVPLRTVQNNYRHLLLMGEVAKALLTKASLGGAATTSKALPILGGTALAAWLLLKK